MTISPPKPLWTPTNPEKSKLSHFQSYIERNHDQKFRKFPRILFLIRESYHDLWRWSITHTPQFWYEVYHYLQVKGENAPESPKDVVDDSLEMFPRPTWFKGTSLNFAENLLYPIPAIEDPNTAVAIIEASEAGVQNRVSWTLLRERVGQFTAALRAAGVTKGDRIGGMLEHLSI